MGSSTKLKSPLEKGRARKPPKRPFPLADVSKCTSSYVRRYHCAKNGKNANEIETRSSTLDLGSRSIREPRAGGGCHRHSKSSRSFPLACGNSLVAGAFLERYCYSQNKQAKGAMDSNNPSTPSYSDDDEQYGHGEGFDLPSPWEDRVFWENRNANQNHFYRTSSTFTSSSTASTATESGNDQKVASTEKEADSKADSPRISSDDGEEYQVAVSRGKDGNYHVSTSTDNMDDEVMAMFSPPVSGDGNDAEGSSSVFRPEVKSERKSKDVPSLAAASTNSSEWSKEDEDESVNTTSSVRSVFMLLSVATIGYVIATNVADGTKLIKSAIGETNGMGDYSSPRHQESDAAEAVTEFEEYCKKCAYELFFHLLFQLTHLIQNLTNLNIWREKAEDLLSGALPMSWAGW